MIIASNRLLRGQMSQIVNILNARSAVWLFSGPVTVDPATPLAAFSPATFDTFVPKNTSAGWSIPAKQIDGEYTTRTTGLRWDSPVAVGGLIRGWYIYANDDLFCSEVFPAPFNFQPGMPRFSLNIRIALMSGTVFPGV